MMNILEKITATEVGFWIVAAMAFVIAVLVLRHAWKMKEDLIAYFGRLVAADTKDEMMHFITLVGSLAYIVTGCAVCIISVTKDKPPADGVVTLITWCTGIFVTGGVGKEFVTNFWQRKDTKAEPTQGGAT